MFEGFYGRYAHNVDDKGRFIIPNAFREILTSPFLYICLGFDENNLIGMRPEEWVHLREAVDALPDTDETNRQFKRRFMGNSIKLDVDKMGRVLVTEYTRKLAKIEKSAVFVGMSSYFEIWNPDELTAVEEGFSLRKAAEKLNISIGGIK